MCLNFVESIQIFIIFNIVLIKMFSFKIFFVSNAVVYQKSIFYAKISFILSKINTKYVEVCINHLVNEKLFSSVDE